MRHWKRLLLAGSISLMLLLAAGCIGNAPPVVSNAPAAQPLAAAEAPAEPSPAAEPAGDPRRGRAIFESGGEKYTPMFYCSRCHSLDGADGHGPTLLGIAVEAAQRMPGMPAEAYIRQSILEPDAFIIPGYSQNMGLIHSRLLNDQEVEDLVAFLLTQ